MTPAALGALGLGSILALMALRVPVAFSMALVGFVGIACLNSWPAAVSTVITEAWGTATFYELTVIPFFVLMGNVASAAGMSRDLYNAAHAWVGRFRGGLAQATVLGCTGFAALSGSSVASALTIGRVAMPEMARFGYDRRLAAGAVAAGGTLGILIPPSTGFVIYAILTEESIGRLFLAGVLPGLLLTTCFLVTIVVQTALRPTLGPPAPRVPFRQRFAALGRSGAILSIIGVSIGGIYGGVFTPVEAAAVGAVLAVFLALLRGALAPSTVRSVLLRTVVTTVMIYFIIIGANIFSPFLALTRMPVEIAAGLSGFDLGPLSLLAVILVVFIVLGTFLDGFAMMVLVLPIVLPIIERSGIQDTLGLGAGGSDLRVWFGVVMVVIVEMALISPPVGMNVFVVRSVARDVPMKEIYVGILPFWAAMIVCLVVLIAFPEIVLLLPNSMLS